LDFYRINPYTFDLDFLERVLASTPLQETEGERCLHSEFFTYERRVRDSRTRPCFERF
jgi:hypothetical protein